MVVVLGGRRQRVPGHVSVDVRRPVVRPVVGVGHAVRRRVLVEVQVDVVRLRHVRLLQVCRQWLLAGAEPPEELLPRVEHTPVHQEEAAHDPHRHRHEDLEHEDLHVGPDAGVAQPALTLHVLVEGRAHLWATSRLAGKQGDTVHTA